MSDLHADLRALVEDLDDLERKALNESEATRSEARANFCAGQAHASRHWATRLRALLAKHEGAGCRTCDGSGYVVALGMSVPERCPECNP